MGDMVNTQVVMEFVRRSPAHEAMLDTIADACLDALNRDARFLAFGPVISVDYGRSAIELECTVCADTDSEDEVDGKIERIGEIVRSALATAEYATSAERVPTPA